MSMCRTFDKKEGLIIGDFGKCLKEVLEKAKDNEEMFSENFLSRFKRGGRYF